MFYKAILIFIISFNAFAYDCSYSVFKWNTIQRKIIGPIEVKKMKSELSKLEIGPYGCTVCREDQKRIKLANGREVLLCNKIAGKLKYQLDQALFSGFPVNTLKGYIVKMTRGEIDKKGFRTGFSNHSYGTAIDINRNDNGMYNKCLEFSPACVLSQGGKWSVENPNSIKADSMLVNGLKEIGLKWGGEIKGKQKDFMHFSTTGY
jgi:hypothetical protein